MPRQARFDIPPPSASLFRGPFFHRDANLEIVFPKTILGAAREAFVSAHNGGDF